MTTTGMRLLGNLDCEDHWARQAAEGTRRRPRIMRRAIRERISRYATLMRVFAQKGDSLWTPVPVDPACVRDVEGLPMPTLESGPLEALPPAGVRMAWGNQDTAAARVNHRDFAHTLARKLGIALTGSRMVHRLDHLSDAAARIGPWVLKAPHSAAGRGTVRGTRGPLSSQIRAQAARLLAEHGGGLFEPWVERTADFGYGAFGSPHLLSVDGRGRFRGVVQPGTPLPLQERLQIAEVREAVSDALGEAGYDGLWGVDAYRYRDASGAERLQPLGEINARLTFGHVATALVERVAWPRWGSGRQVALRFGSRAETPDSPSVISLLGSSDGATMHAWLAVDPAGPTRH